MMERAIKSTNGKEKSEIRGGKKGSRGEWKTAGNLTLKEKWSNFHGKIKGKNKRKIWQDEKWSQGKGKKVLTLAQNKERSWKIWENEIKE